MAKKLRFGKSIPSKISYHIAAHPAVIPPTWTMKKNETNELRSLGARLCLNELAHKLSPKNYPRDLINRDQIEITNHTYLKKIEIQHAVSIAHTNELGMAALGIEIDSLGVDIELKSRVIKAGIEKFFINSEDTTSLHSLEIWCIKEASFKALSPYKNLWEDKEVLTLKDIAIKEDGAYYRGKKFADLALYEEQDLLYSFCWF
jgi:phosphopantetheinyl transferase (holo-ACP synthase)